MQKQPPQNRHNLFLISIFLFCILICIRFFITTSASCSEIKSGVKLISQPEKIECGKEQIIEGKIIGDIKELRVIIQTPSLEFLFPTVKINEDYFYIKIKIHKDSCYCGNYRFELLGNAGQGPSILYYSDIPAKNCMKTVENRIEKAITHSLSISKGSKNRAWSLFHSINALRTFLGYTPLKSDPILASVAARHGENMKIKNFFGHTSPDSESLQERLKKANVSYSIVAEVITIASSYEKALINLTASPAHLSSIIETRFNTMGVAVVKKGNQFLFVTLLGAY